MGERKHSRDNVGMNADGGSGARPEDVTGRVFERSQPSHLQVSVAAAFVDDEARGLRIRSLGELREVDVFRLRPNQILQSRDGIGHLDAVGARLVRLIARTIPRLSGAEWFVLLTAARSVFDLFLAAPIVFETFEIAHEECARSRTRVDANEMWVLELAGPSQRQLHLLDRLLGAVLFLQKIRTIRRRIEKDQSLCVPGSGDLLDLEFHREQVFADERSLELETAIARYDDRQQGEPGGGAHLGITGIARTGEPHESDTVFAWFDSAGQPAADWFDIAGNDPWFAQLVNLQASVPAAYEKGHARPIRVDVISALLNFSSAPIVVNGNSGTWSRSGYAILPVDPYLNKIQESLIGYGYASQVVVAELRASRTTYPAGTQYVLDLQKATSELLSAHERPSEGTGANRWGKVFEEEVQDMVDSTPWRPGERVRTLIGRRIKRTDGTTLTDVDAVAFKDGTLILMDAKAYQFKRETRIGGHSATRNMREKVEAAAKDWSDNIAHIRNHPEALQLDGVRVAEIHGLVVLPSVPFVLDGPPTERVLGLFRACTVHELRARLQAES